MIPRSHRLTGSDVDEIVRFGKRFADGFNTVFARRSRSNNIRIACVVGKRVARSAVHRHRIQRWMREAAREYIYLDRWTLSLDMVWVAKPKMGTMKQLSEVKEHISDLMKHIEHI